MNALINSRLLNGSVNGAWNAHPLFFVDRLHRELQNAFAGDDTAENGAQADWSPAVDIRESKDAYVITADLPGVNPQDIEVTTEARVLTLRGSRAVEANTEGFARLERQAGRFERRFKLPESANPESITAKSAHGVLTLTIAKRAEVQPRKIEVTAA